VNIGLHMSRDVMWKRVGGSLSLLEDLLILATFDFHIEHYARKERGGGGE